MAGCGRQMALTSGGMRDRQYPTDLICCNSFIIKVYIKSLAGGFFFGLSFQLQEVFCGECAA